MHEAGAVGIALDAALATAPPGAAAPRGVRGFVVEGVVQGVGFRPFVWRLATELGLDGSVRNLAGRVEVVVGGDPAALDAFAARLSTDAPPRSRAERVTVGQCSAQRVAVAVTITVVTFYFI
ncbi:MAG: acylphosphatase [Chloroflexota bacterium]